MIRITIIGIILITLKINLFYLIDSVLVSKSVVNFIQIGSVWRV